MDVVPSLYLLNTTFSFVYDSYLPCLLDISIFLSSIFSISILFIIGSSYNLCLGIVDYTSYFIPDGNAILHIPVDIDVSLDINPVSVLYTSIILSFIESISINPSRVLSLL